MNETHTHWIVAGDGWSALGAVGYALLHSKESRVIWITGTGSRLLPALSTLDASEAHSGVAVWADLARRFQIDAGSLENGSFLREFRNKVFREPVWNKAPTSGDRESVMAEVLWAPERTLTGSIEERFSNKTLAEVEEALRSVILSHSERVRRIEGNPIESFEISHGVLQAVLLGSGERIEGARLIFADRWSSLPAIQGLPKPLPFLRKRDLAGAVQVVFTHREPVAIGVRECFYGAIHRESGEEMDRHVWGYFTSDGRRSVWTLCLSPEEAEDNHEIAKKLRRLKSALDKMFVGSTWLGEGVESFLSTVVDEQVRLEESCLYSSGEAPSEEVKIPSVDGVSFLTDGYGPSCAMKQVGMLFMNDQPHSVDQPLSLF